MRAYAEQQHTNAAGVARVRAFAECASPSGSWSLITMSAPTTDRKHGRPRRTPVSMP